MLSVLISIRSSDAGRPAKHLYGLSRVSRSLVVKPDLSSLSRDAIKRCIPVQKLCQFTHPLSIQVDDGCRLVPCGTSGSSFLRTCGWGGVAKLLLFHSFVGYDRELNEPGAAGSHTARAPGGRIPRGVDRWRCAQSNPRSPAAPNADRRCCCTSEFGR